MNRRTRITRNAITAVVIIALGVAMAFTTGLVGSHAGDMSAQGGQSTQQMAPPDMNGSGNGSGGSSDNSSGNGAGGSSDSNSSNQQSGQPPTPPDGNSSSDGSSSNGDSNGQPPTPPDGQQPPDMNGSSNSSGGSSGDSSGNGTGESSDSSSSNQQSGQPPTPPDGNNNSDGSGSSGSDNDSGSSGESSNGSSDQGDQQGGQQPPDMNGNMPGQPGGMSTGMKVLTGAEGLAMALLIVYLIMSRGNRKTFKETLPDKKKIATLAVATVLAGGALTAAGILIPENTGSNMQGPPQQTEQTDQNGQSSVDATGATTVDGEEKTLNDTYESTNADESAILVTGGGTLTSDGATLNKKSGDGSNTDSCDFHGVNAGLLVNEGSTAKVKGATIKTAATLSNGVFCTGENSKIEISDSTVTTTGERSCRGLDATNGGTIIADNMKIITQGGSCATLATDRGEGTVTVTNSELETNGAGSPVIYSTGDISIDNTTGTANGAQITVVEGKNSATITNSEVTASAAGNRGDVDVCGIMLYQSMSGDADEGTSTFTAKNSTLSIDKDSEYYKTAPMFFVTNTDSVIKLTNTDLNFGSGTLLSVKGTSEWGNEGSNGGTVKLVTGKQTLTGDIEADDISTVAISLKNGSTFKGSINSDNTAKAITLKISSDSKVTLTGDTYVTSLDDEDTSYSNIDFNGYNLYVDGKAIN